MCALKLMRLETVIHWTTLPDTRYLMVTITISTEHTDPIFLSLQWCLLLPGTS